jgi:hypothetical protein
MSAAVLKTASWVVVPPFYDDAVWRAAVVQAAHAAGRRVHDLDAAPDAAPISDPRTVILTSDAAQPIQAGAPAEAIAGLMTGQGIRLDPHEDPDTLPQHIRALTGQIGQIDLLRPDRVFRRKDFTAGAVEIVPGLALRAPENQSNPLLSPRLLAVTNAVELLDPAHPQATWAPDLFNYNSRIVSGGTRGDLDLTGRPRCLLAGPYIVLPAGRWRATYRLTFDERASRVRFRVDWGGVEDFLSEEFVPGRPGVFEISQEYDWVEPGPAEIRIIVLEGVFDGRMTFGGARVERIS